jgi:DNA polymerase III epsilon subunit-like protein
MGLTVAAYAKIAQGIADFKLRFVESAICIHQQTKHPPKIFYYSATPDIKWLEDTGIETIDIASVAARRIPSKGTFESDSRNSSLDSLYSMYVGPVEKSGRHNAFPDAVMLAEVCCAMLLE